MKIKKNMIYELEGKFYRYKSGSRNANGALPITFYECNENGDILNAQAKEAKERLDTVVIWSKLKFLKEHKRI